MTVFTLHLASANDEATDRCQINRYKTYGLDVDASPPDNTVWADVRQIFPKIMRRLGQQLGDFRARPAVVSNGAAGLILPKYHHQASSCMARKISRRWHFAVPCIRRTLPTWIAAAASLTINPLSINLTALFDQRCKQVEQQFSIRHGGIHTQVIQ
ncbi:hypothetical protein [Xylella taiwanensis]|uniref:hypothetical protein n=1 Tax=Xylella taiwanensis TaxID=1444770 RepID=UPI001E54ECC1|nr:hypothetical protein [Xylella taiwanensis]MCD8460224.1 hypothetical protein [Xylella taiwanensis]